LKAHKGDQLVDETTLSSQPDQIHTVVFEGQDINHITVKAPHNRAFLTEICYDEVVDVEL
jgi:hypothetical protein